MLSRLINRMSIRRKIILPFLVIMAVTSLFFMAISLNFISKNIEKSLNSELDKQSLLVKKAMEERFHKSIFYAQLFADLKKNLDKVNETKTTDLATKIFNNLLNQDLTKVYLSLNDIDSEKKQMYSDIILEGYQGKSRIAICVQENDDKKLNLITAAAGSVKNHGLYYPIITEYSFNNRFLVDIESQNKADLAIIFHGLYNGRLRTETLAGTQLFLQNTHIQKMLSRVLAAPKNANLKRFTEDIELNKKNYRLLLERLDLNPQIYSVVLLNIDELKTIKQNVIKITIFTFMGITIFMIGIYLLVIKRITASISILTEGIKQVAKGDLDHQVEVKTKDEIGKLSHFFNQMVLSLKESTQNVIEEKNRSEAIITNIPEGIIFTNKDNQLILANQMAEKMFGFSLEQVYGKFILECINNQDLLNAIKTQMEQPQQRYSQELKMQHRNQERFYVLNSNIVLNKNQEPIGVITVLRDITQEKELNELREGFLRTVSHELRTPLTSIIGFIDIIIQGAAGPITANQAEYLNISLKQALSLKQLINDLLDLSRMEAGQVRSMLSEIKIEPFLADITNFFMPLVTKKNNQLKIVHNPATTSVIADNEKMRRILINLISNAVKFTQNGEIIISYEQKENYIEFAVKDTGIGLKEHEKGFIFDKFRQVDASSTRQYEGIGLGLPIAKELVELHQGKLWVESEFGHGATFKFTIPLKPKRT